MFTVITIADEVLKSAKRRDRSLTPMQLMKLVYIAYGWALVLLGRRIFISEIEAWKYGPVIPSLYHATKQYGRSGIPAELILEKKPSKLDEETQGFIEDVVSKYSHMSGIELSNLTHQPGTPWDQVYESSMMGKKIPNHLIREHYAEKLSEHRQSSPAAA